MKRRDLKKFIKGTGGRDFSGAVLLLSSEKGDSLYIEGKRNHLCQMLFNAGIQDKDFGDMLIEMGAVLTAARKTMKKGEGDNQEDAKG